MKKTRILIVDDEVSIIRYVSALLRRAGYEVVTAGNGQDGLSLAEAENPMLLILDIMMPRMSGFEVCSRIREWSQVPIIMLSARADESDKVKCLDLGADDYITKPFGGEEFMARVRAVLRRTASNGTAAAHPHCAIGALRISFAERQVTMGGKEVKLTPTEFALLQELAINAGKVLTHTHILQKVWGPEYRDEKEYVHEFISRLRNKIEPDKENPAYIISVPGVGYQLRGEAKLNQ